MKHRRAAIGPELSAGSGATFRVWAPQRRRVELLVEGQPEPIALEKEAGGHHSCSVAQAKAGWRYRFRLDGSEMLYPDPASHYQPEGPHGPSELVDHQAFSWTDGGWKGLSAAGQVLYELHIGTFTREGTWQAATQHLTYLKELGITCIEMMPIADFAGRWGWGYDGVNLFAPTRLYGRPEDLKHFINEAHRLGLGVILDLVYNHFGPDGNYLMEFSPYYLSDKHKSDWGQGINFDGAHCEGVREYFLSNATHWIREYHFDGFRFDATQAIVDDSKEHILAAIAWESRAAAGGKGIYTVCENEPQQPRLVRAPERGGYGMDALWNDDFHHSAMVALAGRNEAYYMDYMGEPQEFVSAAKWGYLYQGQFYRWQQQRRGTPSLDLPPTAFVHYIQNHDQIANYGHGFRAHRLSSLAELKAMTALLLLMPQTPMLFQGQEYAAGQPFHYFADHNQKLAELIRKGRAKEMAQFPGVAQPEVQAVLPDPSSEATFRKCALDVEERHGEINQWIYRLHVDLLKLRREDKVLGRVQRRGDVDGAVLGPGTFILRYFSEDGDDRLLIVNLDRDLHMMIAPEPLLAAPAGKSWQTRWSSEHPDYGGSGAAPLETQAEDWRMPGENWTIPGRCAVLLETCPFRECRYPGPKRVGLEEDELK